MQGRLYKRPESSAYWMEINRPGQKKLRRSTRTSNLEEANEVLKKELERFNSISWETVVVSFFEVKATRLAPKTLAGYKTSARTLHPFLSGKSLSEIDKSLLKTFIRERQTSVSDTAIKRDLAFVSTVISFAMQTMDGAPDFNIVMRYSKKHLKENTRTRWLRPEEYQRVLAACENDVQRTLVQTFCLTGLRHDEMAKLRKSMINFDRKEIILPKKVTKRTHERVIPMCDQLCHSLKALCLESPDDLVFCYMNQRTRRWTPYTSFKSFWSRVKVKAKLPDVRIHDLRHTFASWFVQNGGGLLALKDILGHSDLQMVQRYAHLDTAAHHREIQEVFGHKFDTGQNDR